MPLNTSAVYVGRPDQSLTTGAVQSATPLTGLTAGQVTIDARAALDATAWGNGGGYVSQNGLTLSQNRSTTKLKDWGLNGVRTLLEDFTGSVRFGMLQTDETSMKWMVGDANVTTKAATQTAGTQLTVAIGAQLPPARAWVFSMKDEDRRMRIYIPNGTITAVADVNFVSNDGVIWDMTIECDDDGTGHCIYILTDDGVISA